MGRHCDEAIANVLALASWVGGDSCAGVAVGVAGAELGGVAGVMGQFAPSEGYDCFVEAASDNLGDGAVGVFEEASVGGVD